MLKSSLCGYSNAYIFVKGIISNIQAIFKKCAPFNDWITEINDTQVDSVKVLDVVLPMDNLIEYSDSYSKTFGSLYQFCRVE